MVPVACPVANSRRTERRRHWRVELRAVLAGLVALAASPAVAQDLSNRSFHIQAGGSGITSLKRANDVHDTDYIAANSALGRLIIKFRTTPNGDWQELAEILPQSSAGQSIVYAMGRFGRPL